MKLLCTAVLCCLVCAASGAYGQDVLLLQDDFSVSAGSSDENFELGRQTGALAPLAYTQNSGASYQTQVGHPVHPGGLAIFAARQVNAEGNPVDPNQSWYVSTSPDFDFGGLGTVDYHVAVTPMIPTSYSADVNWAALVIGETKGQYVVSAGAVSVLVRGNGGYQIFVDGAVVVDGDATPLTGTTHTVDVTVSKVSPGECRLSVALDGTDVLTDHVMSYVPAHQYVSLVGVGPNGIETTLYDQHGFDDLAVSTPAHTSGDLGPAMFADSFDSGTVMDANLWMVRNDGTYSGSQTQFNQTPVVQDGYARLSFETYNPDNPGTHFAGSYVTALPYWRGLVGGAAQTYFPPIPDSGIRFETKVRYVNQLSGQNLAWWLYEDIVGDGDEIDYEYLPKQPASNPLVLTTWRDWYQGSTGRTESTQPDLTGVINPPADWNTYRLDCFTDRVEFYVNDTLVSTHTDVVPLDGMGMKHAIVDGGLWAMAADPSLVPTSNPGENQVTYYDIDYATANYIVPENSYVIDFEAPVYTYAGWNSWNLDGQDGWTASLHELTRVGSDGLVLSGSQSLRATYDRTATRYIGTANVGTGSQFSFLIKPDTLGLNGRLAIAGGTNIITDAVVDILFTTDGLIKANSVDIGTGPYDSDVYEVICTLDLDAGTYDVTVTSLDTGVVFGSLNDVGFGPGWSGGTGSWHLIVRAGINETSGSFYYDNIVITPPPASQEPVCGDANHPYPTGDLNSDCYVEWADFGIFASNWQNDTCADPDWCAGADFNADGTVEWADFGTFASNWQTCTDPGDPCNYNP